MYRWLLLIAVFIAALVGLAVGVLNPDPVTLELALITPTYPLGAMILVAFGVGVVIGLILFWLLFDLPARVRRRMHSKETQGANLPSGHG